MQTDNKHTPKYKVNTEALLIASIPLRGLRPILAAFKSNLISIVEFQTCDFGLGIVSLANLFII